MNRVLMLATARRGGGAETQVARLAAELEKMGWDVEIASLLAEPGLSLGMREGVPDPRGLLRLLAILQRFRPAILHSHLFHANLMARLARLLWPAPVVVSTLHSMAESGSRSRGAGLRDFAYRLTDPLANLTVAVCQAVAARHIAARAVSPRKIRAIANGVDTLAFRPDSELRRAWRARLGVDGEFLWVAAGRLMWKKDYPALLRAFAGSIPGQLVIAGQGPQEAELRASAAALGVPARFLGRVDDMPGLLNAADCFLLSSQVEGLPMVLLEAAACGVPAIVTDAGGAGEALRHGETGFVVPVGDTAQLAEAARCMAALRPEVRAAMGLRARTLAVEKFEIRAVAAEWDRTYRELLERPL
jgi:glycosyltransferase involved in cell wall biosynthesis